MTVQQIIIDGVVTARSLARRDQPLGQIVPTFTAEQKIMAIGYFRAYLLLPDEETVQREKIKKQLQQVENELKEQLKEERNNVY